MFVFQLFFSRWSETVNLEVLLEYVLFHLQEPTPLLIGGRYD